MTHYDGWMYPPFDLLTDQEEVQSLPKEMGLGFQINFLQEALDRQGLEADLPFRPRLVNRNSRETGSNPRDPIRRSQRSLEERREQRRGLGEKGLGRGGGRKGKVMGRKE